MSQPLPHLTIQSNWNPVYDEHRNAIAVTDKDFAPIAAFEIGFLFESHILAVRCLSASAKAHWRFGGSLSQKFPIGTGGTASSLPEVIAAERQMRLNRTALIRFPKLTSNYQLVFEPAYWHQHIRLTIWEYVGPESDTTEELIQTLKIDLFRIENKIDTLNQ